MCLCLGSTGPLYAGYMLAGGYSWRLFFYVEAAFAAALLIAAFFFVEESTYHRSGQLSQTNSSSQSLKADRSEVKEKEGTEFDDVSSVSVPPRKSFLSTLKPWSALDPEPDFFMTIARSFTYFFVPAVFWVITTYGMKSIKKTESTLYTNFISRIIHWPRRLSI